MQVKRDTEKIILQFSMNEYVLVLRLHTIWHGCSLFSKWNENFPTRPRSLYKVFPEL